MRRYSVFTITIILAIAAFAPAASAATTPLQSLVGGINCSGRLTFVGKDATSYRFVERITKSTSTGGALARGIARFTPLADGSLDYAWKLDGGGQSAAATLRRSVT